MRYFLKLFFIFFCFFGAKGQDWEIPDTKTLKINYSPQYYVSYRTSIFDESKKEGFFNGYLNLHTSIKGNYQNNKKHGKWESYYPSGNTMITGNYLQDLKHGHWEYFYAEGQKRADTYFNLGNRVGTWKSYHKNGKLQTEIYYGSENEASYQKVFDRQGILIEEIYTKIIEGKKVVQIFGYFPDGKPREAIQIVNDSLDGPLILYHSGGIIWQKMYYDMGLLVEIEAMRAPKGEGLRTGGIKDGDGKARRYHSDGSLYSIENYKLGLKHGAASYYSQNTLRARGQYQNGYKIGTWEYYSKFGKLKKKREYIGLDESIFYETFYMTAGGERSEGYVKNNMRDGEWKEFNFYGELIRSVHFHLGRLHGPYTEFTAGNIKKKGQYFYGEKVGVWENSVISGKNEYSFFPEHAMFVDTNAIKLEENEPKIVLNNSYTRVIDEQSANLRHFDINLDNYLSQNVFYQSFLPPLSEQVIVIVAFSVDEFGEVKETNIVRGLNPQFDAAVIQTLKKFPFLAPKYVDGIPVVEVMIKEITFFPR